MKTIRMGKARSTMRNHPPSVTIIIDDELPEPDSSMALELYYQKQASVLINILSNSLPQGTFDRLGIEFMKKKVSLYQGKIG
jgi:hypothetical protein